MRPRYKWVGERLASPALAETIGQKVICFLFNSLCMIHNYIVKQFFINARFLSALNNLEKSLDQGHNSTEY